MLKIGDTVKVSGTTSCGGIETELIPIGTICEITDIFIVKEDIIYNIKSIDDSNYCDYWYLEKDLERVILNQNG